MKSRFALAQAAPPYRRRSAAAIFTIAALIAAAGGCSEGYDVPPLSIPCDDGCPLGMKCDGATGLCAPQGDVDCAADEEPSQGDMCTRDCLTASCGGERGKRICTCEGGVFVQCACLPPDDWPYDDVPTAPYCDALSGEPRYLAGETCSSLSQQCLSITSAGQGCVCRQATLGLIWTCGSGDALMIAADAPVCETLGSGQHAVLHGNPCDTQWDLCISRTYNPTGTSPRGCVCGYKGDMRWWCGATNRWFRAE
jgi:hypothetical protein